MTASDATTAEAAPPPGRPEETVAAPQGRWPAIQP